MKLELTDLAKDEFNNLLKIQNELLDSDIDLYYDFSSYDQLLFDMQMFADGGYVENNFDSIEQFAKDISESEGSEISRVLKRIDKAILLDLIIIRE
jgi:hypothetical protein